MVFLSALALGVVLGLSLKKDVGCMPFVLAFLLFGVPFGGGFTIGMILGNEFAS